MKYRLKHLVEYAALRTVAGLLSILPYRAALALGWCIAWPAFHLFRFRVSDACARIREVFGDRYSPREVRRIAWLSMRNFTFTAIESLRMPKLTRETATALIDIGDFQRLRDHAATGKGAILVVPHTGNWEMAGVAAHLFGLPMFLIVGKQRNLLVDAYLNRMRGVSGMEIIPRDSSTMFKKVVRNLREGKFLAFMTDLRSRTPGMRVQFLGKEANVVAGMAVFARLGNVPVFPVVVTRIGWARHKWEFFDPVCPDPALDRDPDAQRMTQAVMDIYDRAIRAQPEQYFWFNKRWVLDPLRVEECRVPGVEGVPATPDT